jgi:long-chain acyl-CoA synthetase
MERPWLRSYPSCVPADLPASEFTSLQDLLQDRFRKYHDTRAFSCMGTTLTFGQVEARSRDMAAYLISHLKLKKGDRVAVMMPNVQQYVITMCALLRSGLVVVNVNPLYTARELLHQLQDSGATVLVVLENFASVVEEVQKQHKIPHIILTSIGDMFSMPKKALVNFVIRKVKKLVPAFSLEKAIAYVEVLRIGKTLPISMPTLHAQDLAFLQYTGGTTGVSKGAMLSHGNLLANISQAHLWIKPYLGTEQEVLITALPLYHIFSLTVSLTYFSMGGFNVLITNPRDIKGFIKELRANPFSAFGGVNTLFNALLSNPEFSSVDFSHFRLALGGGMAVQTAVANKWHQVTGIPLTQAYGLTETSPAVCINPLHAGHTFTGSIGVPLSSTWVSIRNDRGEEVPLGSPGEIWVKGPQVMQGYWKRPKETEEVLTADGWLKTGDIAIMDEAGFVTIIDRKKDMIIVSGFNVYPNEIEDVVASHPMIQEVAVIGVSDVKSGEAVKLFVVRKDASLTEEQVREYCKQNLTGYKVPRYIEFRNDLPKSNVGKVLRRCLKENVQTA